MNKLFTKIAALALGATMAIGVGVAVAGNRDVTPVSATVGSDVTIGDGTYTSAYETGFENCTASTTYNSTKTYTSSVADGAAWSVYYGTVSTNAVISDSKSMHMRWYASAKTNYPHAETTSSIANVKAFKFNYAVGNKNVDFVVQYGTNGSSWTDIETVNTTGTSTTEYSHEFSSAISTFYFRVLVCLGTAPTSGNYTFRIDDVVFGSPQAVACTVTLNKNGGSGGTDSVSATKGSAMPTLASAPTRTGYTFAGYYDDASAGTQYYTANRASARNWDKDGTTATLYAHWTANQYNINYYDQGGSAFSGSHESGYPTKHTYGTDTTLKSATKGGYNFDGWFTTSACTGSAVSTLGATSYTDAINLYAKWTASGNTYSITTIVSNGTYSGDTSITDNGGVASVTIAPTGDYKLPASVSVSGASHTYNATTGVISLSNATGPVIISAEMVALTPYSIFVNETNGSHTGDSTIKESRTVDLTFTPSPGYGQPSSVTVSGATYIWTRGTGVLSLSNPTGNVIVTYEAVGNELDSITISPNSGSYTLGDDFVKPTVTAHYTVAADANVTSSATYFGYDPYTIGSQSVTISYTEGGITKTKPYTATVSAKTVGYSYDKISAVSDITEGDYILAYSKYAFDGRDANNGYTEVTITNDSISGTAAMDKLALHITPVTDGYTLQISSTSDNNASKYLGFTSGSNSLSFNANPVTIASQTVSSSTHYTHASGGAFTFGDSKTVLSWNNTNSALRYRFYKTSTTSSSTNGKDYYAFDLYKKENSGSASLIRITATYTGGEKYVGDPIHTSDFAVKKQLDTSASLVDVASGYTISADTLASESNTITISYTEGDVTKTADVVVAATPRAATVTSVTLVQGPGVVKDYIDYSGTAWDFTDLTVECKWTDSTFDETFDLADLVESGDATISPPKPSEGVTSFTVSYTYHEKPITDNTVTGISVVADYVTSISWTGTHAEDFKAFSGSQLTVAQVGAWSVVPTFAGAGQQSALSFGSYTLKVGNKTISSLPYTWASEDDGQKLTITYGKDKNGEDFVKENATAVANICTTINAIDHDETISGKIEKTATMTKDDAIAIHTASGVGDSAGVAVDHDIDTNIHITGDKGSHASSFPVFWKDGLRVYAGNTLTISPRNGAIITSISLTSSNATCSAASGSSPWSITSGGDDDIVITIATKTAPIGSSIVVEYTIEGSETTTVHYANDMNHFDAQKKVVEFAKFMNTTMNGTNVCSGSFVNLESAWDDVAGKYDELFGASTTLNETELAWAKNMLKYATAAWGSDAEAACVEKAMKTYEHCVSTYDLEAFMSPVRSVPSVKVSPLVNIIGENTNTVAIIVIISMVSVTAIGGYFFFRKRKENI